MLLRRLSVALAVAAGLSGSAIAEDGWVVRQSPDQMPRSLMPRRYVDYPVAYALWQLSLLGTRCAVALGDPELAAEARHAAARLLAASGTPPGESEERAISIFEATSAMPPAGELTGLSAPGASCREDLREAVARADTLVVGLAARRN